MVYLVMMMGLLGFRGLYIVFVLPILCWRCACVRRLLCQSCLFLLIRACVLGRILCLGCVLRLFFCPVFLESLVLVERFLFLVCPCCRERQVRALFVRVHLLLIVQLGHLRELCSQRFGKW